MLHGVTQIYIENVKPRKTIYLSVPHIHVYLYACSYSSFH